MKKLILAGLLVALSSVAVFADTFTLKNGTSSTFYEVYISLSDSDDWGDELLGDEYVIEPGDSMTFDVAVKLNSTTIDIGAVDEDENAYTIYDRQVRNGATVTITLADLDEDA